MGAFFHRWRWILIVVVVVAIVATLAVAGSFLTSPVRQSDKSEAARQLVAWIAENHSVSGLDEYPDAKRMRQTKRFFVFCDFAPPEFALSGESRVQRVTAQERKAAFAKHRFNETVYMDITLISESDNEIVLEFSIAFGNLGGHRYVLRFQRKVFGLRARIMEELVS